MKNSMALTLDSLSNANEDISNGLYDDLKHFIDEASRGAGEFGLELNNVNIDEAQDSITATVAFDDIQDVKDWIRSANPSLTFVEIDAVLAGQANVLA